MPPEIVPFKFPENAGRDGAFAQVVCVVAAGDAPLNISWHYNGVSDLPMGTNIQLIGDRTSILTIPSVSWLHSGDYDCLAQNSAGKISFAAELSVQGRRDVCAFLWELSCVEQFFTHLQTNCDKIINE